VETLADRFGEADSPVSRLKLASGAVASFEPCLPVQIHALDGWLWITQEGDDRDNILSPGNDFLSTRHGKLVVQALDGATIEVRRLCEG
jgi:hypothetical protein